MPPFPIIVLALVFAAIAVRRIGRFRISIWQAMASGALLVLATGQIAISSAISSINIDVMLFLFGMFTVGQAIEESGLLSRFVKSMFRGARSADAFLLVTLLGFAFLSAFLMNDTVAVIATPAVLAISRKTGISPKLMMISLAFSVTIGSVVSPIGNPQNLLIAVGAGIANPFWEFARLLLAPTLINLGIAFLMLKAFFKPAICVNAPGEDSDPADPELARLSLVSAAILCLLIVAKIAIVVFSIPFDLKLTYIALAAMLPVVAFSRKRLGILSRIDWHTLVFFASMFVMMQSVWDSGFFQGIIEASRANLAGIPMILTVSVVLSQFLSNVPLVALYMPVLQRLGAGPREMVALAAGSTIAGNMLVLGAASTVLIIQNAEKRTGDTLTFLEFARIGIPMTVVNVVVYWVFLSL